MKISELHKLFLASSGISTDTRKIKEKSIFFALKGENFNGNTFAKEALKLGANYAIVDEKINIENKKIISVENVLSSLQQLATYHRNYLKLPIIAITGSNGKTTTKELIHRVLSQKFNAKATVGNLNNHIGVPLTLLSFDSSTEIGIVEMGANHQKEIEKLTEIALPDYGYITNFGKAHLEGFGGVAGVIKGKSELYKHLQKHDKKIFINADDELQLELTENSNTISFSEHKKADYTIKTLSSSPTVIVESENTTIKSNLIGNYNTKNIAIAIAIGSYFEIEINRIKAAIESYLPDNNRSQIIEKNNNKIILDAYNANPTSMAAALESFKLIDANRKIVILGDMFEIGKTSKEEHQIIIDKLKEYNFDEAFVLGKDFKKTEINSDKIQAFQTFEEFKDYFKKESVKKSTILIKGSRGMKLERVLELL
ncbi:UDP-N-acetylmuramoyl-tripeptide--D-alanyl-D-alanine ligase [Mesonia maritima]|uniref:UDP-N-acetylmuramoyl-tripeptide--D-alanyl-D-alanine ligase n=1 Tax=Mesonia maritima TaxID=1793873 RepID=A0ABU1K8K7_9FLAO|nr:UDP-N-acetylmuramoyl-tripeptide--D-alanyl-D-alanine ligase [Mesonia maritima]MDR6301938.1 UDP-N-acetylmuramoyl-tripeptide--D-alanyl-D-alanine ligase [Mesonia maritima]